MKYYNNILELVGHTPLVKLNKITQGLNSLVLAKLEFLNPGGSIKDRIGISMVEDAEHQGSLKPGGVLIEPTSGNTGIGVAMTAAVKGYKCKIVLSEKISQEKVNLLKAFGAEVIITPKGVPKESPDSIYNVAKKLTETIPGAYQPNQYSNPVNPETHYKTTGPEIWEQTEGKIDILVAGVGTGGTITGTAKFLKEKNHKIKIIGVDPEGSLFTSKVFSPYETEGIGADYIPEVVDVNLIDEFITVNDKDSFLTARRLAEEEGILVGGSGGSAVWATLKVAKKYPEKKIIVVILPDTGRNYLSKFYSDEYMHQHNFIKKNSFDKNFFKIKK